MSEELDPKQKAAKKARKKPRSKRHKKPVNRAVVINDLLARAIDEIKNQDQVNASFSEVIRLLQLQKEFSQEEIREIEVKWVDVWGTEDASNK